VVERADIVLASLSGDYAKPRPALVVQGNSTLAVTGSVTFCLTTSELIPDSRLRIDVVPDGSNGLRLASQVQTDKIYTLPAGKIRGPIGRIDRATMSRIDLAQALHLDLIAP
jgi:mRNA interferase MazF